MHPVPSARLHCSYLPTIESEDYLLHHPADHRPAPFAAAAGKHGGHADQCGDTMALINVAAPFVGVGSGIVLIKNVARDKTLFAEYWGNGLLMTLITGVATLLLALGVGVLIGHSNASPAKNAPVKFNYYAGGGSSSGGSTSAGTSSGT